MTLWPFELVLASLRKPPFQAPSHAWLSRQAAAVLRLGLCLSGPGRELFMPLALESLRFFLKGQGQFVFPLYQLIFNNTLDVALADAPTDPLPTVLDPRSSGRWVSRRRGTVAVPGPARSWATGC